MKFRLFFILLLLHFFSFCKREECNLDCTSTYLDDLYLGDSIMDSIPYNEQTGILHFSNQFGDTLSFSDTSFMRHRGDLVLYADKEYCPGSGFGAGKKEGESKTCLTYYNSEFYRASISRGDNSFTISCGKNIVSSTFVPPPNSIKDVLYISLDLKIEGSYVKTHFGSACVTFGNPIFDKSYDHPYIYYDSITLNGTTYTSVYELYVKYVDSWKVTKFYYNTSLGLLGFVFKNGENWYLNE